MLKAVLGSLDKRDGRRCHLLLNKDGTLDEIFLPPFLSNEPSTVQLKIDEIKVQTDPLCSNSV
jgi:hypothetical protein